MSLDVSGFFDDRSTDRLGIEPGVTLVGTLSDVAQYVKEHGTDVIFIALPLRHVKRVMDLLDDLRDTTASIYYVPDIFVFDLIQARSGEIHGIPVVAMCETPFYGVPRRRETPDGHRVIRRHPAAAAAAAAADRRSGQSFLARSGDLQTAPLRPGWTGNRRLQIQDHERHRRRLPDSAGVEIRQTHHPHRRRPQTLLAR